MTSEADLEAVCGQLSNAVRVIMDPRSPKEVRLEAYQYCESFKESASPGFGIQCSVLLSGNSDKLVQHFGLKLLEDVIKLKWNDMAPEQKLYVKENAMRICETGIADLLKEPKHIKDAVARIIVEIVKREWPQQWPSFLTELEALCSRGDTQTEIGMFVMLRLVEDVAVLQNLEQNQRRKEIYQALTAHMETIFQFLLTLLERHYQAYITNTASEVKQRHAMVCQAVLETFTSFVEWVPIQHIMANNHYLIRCLCHLLRDEVLQIFAAECLLAIVSTKVGKTSDRAQLLVLFKNDLITPLFQAVEAANVKTIQEQDDQPYLFLKRMVQILVELGGQVCSIWPNQKEGGNGNGNSNLKPENFNIYLNALLAFTSHDSQVVNYYANELWAKFCRHSEISKDDTFKTFIPKWIEVAFKKAVKTGLPSKEDHPSCVYSKIDFESDDEFSSFFGRYRLIMAEVIKLISANCPSIPYQYCDQWLRSVLVRPIKSEDRPVGKMTPIYLELDAIQWILDAITSKLDAEALASILAPAQDLLKQCLDYNSTNDDPMLKSVVLSSISSLFVVITLTPGALNPTLNEIFKCITFTEPGAVSTSSNNKMSDSARALRRHGAALLVKIGTRHPQVLVPVFDFLRTTILDLYFKQKVLFKMEFVTLVEALVLVSNEFQNYDMQSAFIEQLAAPIFEKNMKNLEAVIAGNVLDSYIGLDMTKDCSENRSEVSFCLNFVLSLARRASAPSDQQKCRDGGFIDPSSVVNGSDVIALRNPAAGVGCHALNLVLRFFKALNDMNKLRTTNPVYAKIFAMLDSEKQNVLGLTCDQQQNNETNSNHRKPSVPQVNGNGNGNHDSGDESNGANDEAKNYERRLQHFVYEQFENVCHILSQFCSSFGHQFYKQPGLAQAIVQFVFGGVDHVPDFRLRSIVRLFLKNFVNKCPKECFVPVLAPVLSQLCPYMLNRLTEKWKQLIIARESPNFDEDNTDSQEVLDDVIGRQFTREYLDVIKAVLTSGGGSDLASSNAAGAINKRQLSASSESLNKGGGTSNSQQLSLSDLGNLVMQNEGLRQCITLTLLRALVWPDTQASIRAAVLLELIMPVVSSSEQMSDADASHVMITILQALQTLGQYELNNITLIQLSVQTYEQLRPKHPVVADVLAQQVPGINTDDLRKFDDKVMQNNKGKAGDRVLKAMFKKLVAQLVGKDVANLGKMDVVIKNLPTLQLLKPRHKTPSLDETEHNDIGITNLFNGKSSNSANTTPTKQPFRL